MHPNAVQDILESQRFEGMIDTIQPVTDVVDVVFTTVITFVAFFIISVALLRNVLAGAYCAFPRFWEQVAQAHEAEGMKLGDLKDKLKDGYKDISMGSIKQFILRLVPNVKIMTDFDDDTLNAKSYFIKAIPQMIAVVIIGVFIYNGYYRDAVSIVSTAGSEIIDRTILSFDPVGFFDTMMNTAGRPAFATDNATTPLDKNKNKAANEIYSAIIAKYTDIQDANSKAELASEIDAAVDAMFGSATDSAKQVKPISEYFNKDDGTWEGKIYVDLLKDFDPSNYTDDQTNKDAPQYCFKLGLGLADTATSGEAPKQLTVEEKGNGNFDPAALQIVFDSTSDAAKNEEWYLSVMLKATRSAVKPTSNSVAYVVLGAGDYTVEGGRSTTNVVWPSNVDDDTTASITITGNKIHVANAANKFVAVKDVSFKMTAKDQKSITVYVVGLQGTNPGVTMADDVEELKDKSYKSTYNVQGTSELTAEKSKESETPSTAESTASDTNSKP